MSDYRVNLEIFEGPLDLLLHLIRKNDLEIADIPIALVLDQYMDTIEEARELNIDLAGDFLLTAAELIHIKSQLLMPVEGEEGEEEGPDPRAELVRRLLEYQRYKEAAGQLMARPLLGREVFIRSAGGLPTNPEETSLEADLSTLLVSFQQVLKRLPQDASYNIHMDRVSVSERIIALTEQLRGQEGIRLTQLLAGATTRSELVLTFLALLEMSKMKMITMKQSDIYDDIYIASKIALAGQVAEGGLL